MFIFLLRDLELFCKKYDLYMWEIFNADGSYIGGYRDEVNDSNKVSLNVILLFLTI